jgi:hypothetical protein
LRMKAAMRRLERYLGECADAKALRDRGGRARGERRRLAVSQSCCFLVLVGRFHEDRTGDKTRSSPNSG